MKSKLNLFILLLTLVISDSTLAQTKGDYVVQGRVPDAVLVNDNDDNEDLFGLSAGGYALVVTDSIGCSTNGSFTVDSELTIENLQGLNMSIYPNPSNGNFNIDFGADLTNATIEIIDLTGKVVYTQSVSWNVTNISVSELASGNYIIKVTSDQGNSIGQLNKY